MGERKALWGKFGALIGTLIMDRIDWAVQGIWFVICITFELGVVSSGAIGTFRSGSGARVGILAIMVSGTFETELLFSAAARVTLLVAFV